MKVKARDLNIKPTTVCMNYTEVDENETQYGAFSNEAVTKIFEAAYVRNDLYPGNPLVEAIPYPRTYKNIFMTCQRGLPGFNHSAIANMPAYKLKRACEKISVNS